MIQEDELKTKCDVCLKNELNSNKHVKLAIKHPKLCDEHKIENLEQEVKHLNNQLLYCRQEISKLLEIKNDLKSIIIDLARKED